MIQFQCDYTEGAHPKIIERLTRTNLDLQRADILTSMRPELWKPPAIKC